MTITREHSKSESSVGVEQWVRMYRRMLMIRLFEEQVNEFYTRARMPGLAHLYVGHL
jgi:pyruvate dehydrogenase E1 component alpha subunit